MNAPLAAYTAHACRVVGAAPPQVEFGAGGLRINRRPARRFLVNKSSFWKCNVCKRHMLHTLAVPLLIVLGLAGGGGAEKAERERDQARAQRDAALRELGKKRPILVTVTDY